ncbi:Golgi apparatus membrane protein TVP23 -like protein, partial [Caligus rogercresseyi]
MTQSTIYFMILRTARANPRSLFYGAIQDIGLLFYLLGDRIGFISSFVLVVLFLCADFWVVKNVSGRLLAGLRWRNFVREDNSTEWRFESWSPEERETANKSQIRAFWALLLSQQCLWSTLFVGALFGYTS